MKNSVHLNVGAVTNKVAFLFSCPGQEEEKQGRPVSGRTGIHLIKLLEILARKCPNVFKFFDIYQYRITNAWKFIEYLKKTGRREAKISEIKQKENLLRIDNELQNMEIVILFGKKAQSVLKLIHFNGILISVPHLSFGGLASIKKDINNNSLKNKEKGNTKKRIEVIASTILQKFKNN
jgi:hypothetical protein